MSGIIVAPGLVISPGVDGLNGNSPVIGYRNIVTESNISATSEADGYPIENVANPSTFLRWIAEEDTSPADEYITVLTETADDIDYLAVARHNFGTGQIAVSVEGLADDDTGTPWVELVGPVLLPNDNPVIFRFTPQPLYAVRLRMQPSAADTPLIPTAAVVYVGLLLLLQRRIYVGHTPMPYGREVMLANHRSIAGNFLGRVVLSKKVATSVTLLHLTPSWYRTNFEPFLLAAIERPFFFGWRPESYPYESGYAWLTDDPKPQNQLPNGMMQITFSMEGIA